jgi:hypothetical protein
LVSLLCRKERSSHLKYRVPEPKKRRTYHAENTAGCISISKPPDLVQVARHSPRAVFGASVTAHLQQIPYRSFRPRSLLLPQQKHFHSLGKLGACHCTNELENHGNLCRTPGDHHPSSLQSKATSWAPCRKYSGHQTFRHRHTMDVQCSNFLAHNCLLSTHSLQLGLRTTTRVVQFNYHHCACHHPRRPRQSTHRRLDPSL